MLYDPKWQQEVKADPFTLESLIAWLEKQPATKHYDFCKWDNCLLAQWLMSIDPKSQNAFGEGRTGFFYHTLGKTVDLTEYQPIASPYMHPEGRTFGAALKRARALQSRRT